MSDGTTKPPSYYSLLRDNREFRFALASYLVTHCGEWLTYVASLSMIEQTFTEESNNTKTAIAWLIVIRMLPNVVFAAIGGVVADTFDRRRSMFVLDLVGAVVTLLFLIAYWQQSIFLLYAATFCQETVASLYQPCQSALVPMLINNPEELKKATTLSGIVWSLMTALGSSLGGIVVAAFGPNVCYVVDSATYLLSAILLSFVRGNYTPMPTTTNSDLATLKDVSTSDSNITSVPVVVSTKSQHPCQYMTDMIIEAYHYLTQKPWGTLVLLKASAAAVFGATDVLNVSFSERGVDEIAQDLRLGVLFGVAGIGCLIGPLVAEHFTNVTTHPSTLLRTGVVSLGVIGMSCFGMGLFSTPFASIVAFSVLRSSGSAALWIDSNILLQLLSEESKMGRVMAVDYALALSAEASSALLCGRIQDVLEWSAEEVSLLLGITGLCFGMIWAYLYRSFLRSVLDERTNIPNDSKKSGGKDEENEDLSSVEMQERIPLTAAE